MDDTQIADFAFPNEVEEATTSFLINEVKVEEAEEATKAMKRSRIKMEELTEEEKYRRMREQNNRASQACRAKRKRKLAKEEEELATLQQKTSSCRPSSRTWRRRWPHTRKGSLSRSPE